MVRAGRGKALRKECLWFVKRWLLNCVYLFECLQKLNHLLCGVGGNRVCTIKATKTEIVIF